MIQKLRICTGLGLCIAGSLSSFAGYVYDPLPPVWRGQTNTTYQTWGFPNSSSVNVPATSANNIYGSPLANITVGAFGSGYLTSLPGLGSQTNYWDLGGAGGSIALSIPHLAGLSTTISLQITYFSQGLSGPPSISITNSFGSATLQSSSTTLAESLSPTPGSWLTLSTTYLLAPAADITDYYWLISGGNGSVVESIVVDTRTVVPEPTTLSLLGLGVAALAFRRKARRD